MTKMVKKTNNKTHETCYSCRKHLLPCGTKVPTERHFFFKFSLIVAVNHILHQKTLVILLCLDELHVDTALVADTPCHNSGLSFALLLL